MLQKEAARYVTILAPFVGRLEHERGTAHSVLDYHSIISYILPPKPAFFFILTNPALPTLANPWPKQAHHCLGDVVWAGYPPTVFAQRPQQGASNWLLCYRWSVYWQHCIRSKQLCWRNGTCTCLGCLPAPTTSLHGLQWPSRCGTVAY